jgi:dihydrofolate reductase
MNIALIAAVSSNNIIGCNGRIPWNLPSDLLGFRDLTMGHAVIMGRITYESLPRNCRPLPGRANIVLSRRALTLPDCTIALSFADAVEAAQLERPDCQRVFVIGGEQVYRQAWPLADEIFLTRVEDAYDGDTWFPPIDSADWELLEQTGLMFENDTNFRFCRYRRR